MKKYYVLAKGLGSRKKFYVEFENLRLAEYFRLMFITANCYKNWSYANIRTGGNNEGHIKLISETIFDINRIWKYMREEKKSF